MEFPYYLIEIIYSKLFMNRICEMCKNSGTSLLFIAVRLKSCLKKQVRAALNSAEAILLVRMFLRK